VGERPATAERSYTTGDRVVRAGAVAFVRDGFATVRWDDGTTTSEWAADLAPEPERT
jgi:hypothetical protein